MSYAEDMKPQEIIGFDATGKALVQTVDGKTERYKLFVSQQHKIIAEKVEDISADQADQTRPARVPVSERWRGIDQGVPAS